MTKEYFQNREISWLKFNERVLVEAMEEHVPPLERLKFVSIFVSNLDEFFMVRVGSLHDLSQLKKEVVDNKTGMTASEQIDAILAELPAMYRKKDAIYKDVMDHLNEYSIRCLSYEELDNEQKKFVEDFYMKSIDQLVSPQIVDLNHPFPFLENNKLYAFVELEKDKEKVFGIVPVRNTYPDYIMLPGENIEFILMEEIILNQINQIFKEYKVVSKNIIKITRNTDFVDDRDTWEEFDDYQAYMKTILKKRKRLNVVRLESQDKLSKQSLKFLLNKLELDEKAYFEINSPLNMKYVFSLIGDMPNATKSILLHDELIQYDPEKYSKSVIEDIRRKDRLLSYPYESMETFISLLREAANDPECKSIKITIYRLAKDSKVVRYLQEAAQNGKEVTVFVELKARFDEESNIHYANLLYEEGCNIIYGFNKYKTHSKICLITFRNPKTGHLNYITQIGTGNYNESTAKQYTDFSLMTADDQIGLDATDFFKNMSLGNLDGKYMHLLQSPTSLKTGLMHHVENEIKKGEDGYILCKFNSLTDKDFIDKFVEASQKGVKIDLIIRGISCLIPGIEGYSDNIRIISIVGRFLEHPRVYVFGKDAHTMYISSADLMTRNTEKRVEIATPILDKDIKDRLLKYLEIQLKDNVGARVMNNNGEYEKIDTQDSVGRLSSQEYFTEEAEKKAREMEEKKDNKAEEREEGFFQKLLSIFKK
ncbi:polyphosphate kinase 1 [Peptoniphilus sp. MSJ-1]|uniref:Polyphosphate kinase n=1 Tax=Peptoniphilus ovalis TaxID=2841503 RepID=A0ABS6FFI1_9FIRM|nr:polyphosphate kinase 1 [Peptoniphilus ovalis]MBU5668793.1 polyphosphate kinase 1 [Peptoniphilus ovalis]